MNLIFAQPPSTHSPELLRLSRALQFETVSTSDSSAFNPSPHLGFISWLSESFPLVHRVLDVKIFNEYTLLYQWKGTQRTRPPGLYVAHYDVVPVEKFSEHKWKHPAFSGHIDNEFVWGRGAIDDKSNLIALLESVERLLLENFTPQQDIYFAFGHDEETGGEKGAKAVAGYFKEGQKRFEFVLDEGGSLVEDVFPGMKKKVAFIGTAEKGYLNLELSVEGVGGHSSVPPNETAIDIIAKAIGKINKYPMAARLQPPTIDMLRIIAPYISFKTKVAINHDRMFRQKILKQLSANNITNTLVRTVFSPTIIFGGIKENALPLFTVANINVRLLQGDSIESVTRHIKATINDERIKITLKPPYYNASVISSTKSRVWGILHNTIMDLFPGVIVAPLLTPGTTDSHHYITLANNVYRFIPITINEENKEAIHGINEKISIKEYYQTIRFYTDLIKRLDKVELPK